MFKAKEKEWKPRQEGIAIGRMYTCNPLAGERYYLRLLLTIIPGAQSFEHLRTVDGREYSTFKDACRALGLLQDDREWISCFTEAVNFATGNSLRILFATALLYQEVSDPLALWTMFSESLCDDLQHQLRPQVENGFQIPLDMENSHLDYGLFLLSELLAPGQKSLQDYNLPLPQIEWRQQVRNTIIEEELNYNPQEQTLQAESMLPMLNEQQLDSYHTILSSLDQPSAKQFFLHGPAGTGKTFLYKCLCSTLRAQGKIVLCVASSGIAAQLLPGGVTSHSRFKIPLNIHEDSICSITKTSSLAELRRSTSLIIWDEVPMQHKHCFDTVSKTLNDICNVEAGKQFGNIPIVLGGDFAQILPVVRHGSRGSIVNACIQFSQLLPYFQQLHLTKNMRILHDDSNAEFVNFLGTMSYQHTMHGNIKLPNYIRRLHCLEAFCHQVFPTGLLDSAHLDYQAFNSRAILAFHNDTVTEFNNLSIYQLQGTLHTFDAMNSVAIDEGFPGAEHIPADFLQSLECASLPPSKLCLKIGAPIILLRNLSPKQGLCNRTRMIVTQLGRSCIGAKISGGQFDGQFRLLPRIKLTTLEGDLPFILTRKQFPIRLCFAMTVNKSQG